MYRSWKYEKRLTDRNTQRENHIWQTRSTSSRESHKLTHQIIRPFYSKTLLLLKKGMPNIWANLFQCSIEGHVSKEYRKFWQKYINCSQQHNSMNKTRPYYEFKHEIGATVTNETLTSQKAEVKVKDNFGEKQKQYSFILKRKLRRENNQTKIKQDYHKIPQLTYQRAAALPETTLPPLNEMVAKSPCTKAKQTHR